MINNDILRRVRYALKLNDDKMLAIFKLMDNEIDSHYLHQILSKEDDKGFILCRDSQLSLFLDGLIIHFRGRQEGQEAPPVSSTINHNDILRKLRIALSLNSDDVIAIFQLADFRISKGELSAFFRKPGHRNYKLCGQQVLRNFLNGMTKKYRDETKTD